MLPAPQIHPFIAALLAALSGHLNIVCAWCGRAMGTKPCIASMDGQITHAMCPACLVKQTYPFLVERIASADRIALAQIIHLEMPEVVSDSERSGLAELISKRLRELRKG